MSLVSCVHVWASVNAGAVHVGMLADAPSFAMVRQVPGSARARSDHGAGMVVGRPGGHG